MSQDCNPKWYASDDKWKTNKVILLITEQAKYYSVMYRQSRYDILYYFINNNKSWLTIYTSQLNQPQNIIVLFQSGSLEDTFEIHSTFMRWDVVHIRCGTRRMWCTWAVVHTFNIQQRIHILAMHYGYFWPPLLLKQFWVSHSFFKLPQFFI